MAEVRLSRKLAVEFLGTAALVFCGPGTAAATFMVGRSTGVPFSMAQLGVIALAFMMVIIAMIYTIGHISGCHINPAVTLALAAARKTAWTDVPGYLAAQFTGAIAGALAIWAILEQPGLDAGLGVLSYHPGHTRAAFCAELMPRCDGRRRMEPARSTRPCSAAGSARPPNCWTTTSTT